MENHKEQTNSEDKGQTNSSTPKKTHIEKIIIQPVPPGRNNVQPVSPVRLLVGSSSCGTFVRLIHWGPLVALFIIFYICLVSCYVTLMWWPISTVSGAIHMAIYLNWLFLILYNMIGSALIGPGFVPLGWKPEEEHAERNLQYCKFCEGFKSPRSHHCRKCNRCVMKMDHHCPWINTCCGHYNHAKFIYFLIFAPIGCIHSCVILVCVSYRGLNQHYFMQYWEPGEPLVTLTVYSFIACMFGIGLALGVTISVGFLFYIQLKSVLKNETGIETWIIDKADYRDRDEDEPYDFIYPYNVGWWRNFKQVFTWSGLPQSNGIAWDVLPGCDQYTLTNEQIKQKEQKRDRSVEVTICRQYGGAIFPITFGIVVCCCPPLSDESRIPVKIGDKISVTRWKKNWVYGDKILNKEEIAEKKRIRGWFPRKCVDLKYQTGKPWCETDNKNDSKKDL